MQHMINVLITETEKEDLDLSLANDSHRASTAASHNITQRHLFDAGSPGSFFSVHTGTKQSVSVRITR